MATMVSGWDRARRWARRSSGLTKWPASGAATQAGAGLGVAPLRDAAFCAAALGLAAIDAAVLGGATIWPAAGIASSASGATKPNVRQRCDKVLITNGFPSAERWRAWRPRW